jgi:hypothetical protein
MIVLRTQAQWRKMKELAEMERQIEEKVESLASIEKSEMEVRPLYLYQTSLPLSSHLSVGLVFLILNVFLLTAFLVSRMFPPAGC